jgi:hypothetical protein
MKTIKIRKHADGPWVEVALLGGERPGWVEVREGEQALWVPLADVDPADQVALMFEQQARQRYVYVPREDLEE